MHYSEFGTPGSPTVVFVNSLGTDLRLWDDLVPHLPPGFRLIRYDKPGHGLSAVSGESHTIGKLAANLESLLGHVAVRDCLLVGISIGGMIAQQLALNRPDIVRAAVLSNTAAKIGDAEMWQARIDAIHSGGLDAIADGVMEKWFSEDFHLSRKAELERWRSILCSTSVEGYIACCVALSLADLRRDVKNLEIPTLLIAGSEDGSTPPSLVKETAALIEGSEFALIEGAGHLPCVEKPREYAEVLQAFMQKTGFRPVCGK